MTAQASALVKQARRLRAVAGAVKATKSTREQDWAVAVQQTWRVMLEKDGRAERHHLDAIRVRVESACGEVRPSVCVNGGS
eukprot:14999467-Alexandrium_andersonii.AAC.1